MRGTIGGEWNVKTGKGGIRDIEFFIHLLQMVNGAHIPELRSTSTLDAIDRLTQRGLISDTDKRSIVAGYIFLRRLENRLQMRDELQTHTLPNSPVEQTRIAHSMGYGAVDSGDSLAAFQADLSLHSNCAGECFEKILAHSAPTE